MVTGTAELVIAKIEGVAFVEFSLMGTLDGMVGFEGCMGHV